jgi:hypothetical protein
MFGLLLGYLRSLLLKLTVNQRGSVQAVFLPSLSFPNLWGNPQSRRHTFVHALVDTSVRIFVHT